MQESDSPSAASINAVAHRSAGWLEHLGSRAAARDDLELDVLCNLLVGAYACDALCDDGTNFKKMSGLLAERLAQFSPERLDYSRAPASLYVLGFALIQRGGVEAPALEDFVTSLTRLLQKDGYASIENFDGAYEATLLLSRLGRCSEPPRLALQAVRDYCTALPVLLDQKRISDLLRHLEGLVALGSWPLTLPPDDLWIAEWVVGLATASLHEYDFVTGTRALRCAIYLGVGGYPLTVCLDFMCLHQRPDGRFGYFGPEQERLWSQSPSAMVDYEMELPICVTSVRTLAEAWRNWRLSRIA